MKNYAYVVRRQTDRQTDKQARLCMCTIRHMIFQALTTQSAEIASFLGDADTYN